MNKINELYSYLIKKYKNFIISIIEKYIIKYGITNNKFIDRELIFIQSLEAFIRLDDEKRNKWPESTLLGHSTVYCFLKYIRTLNNNHNKINFLCGNYSEGEIITNLEDINSELMYLCNDFEKTLEYQSIFESILENAKFNISRKFDITDVKKIVILKLKGYNNGYISELFNTKRRIIYDVYKSWVNKNREILIELLDRN